MGYWGMGISQSDQYCEIYDRFMKEYDRGKPVSDIVADLLEEYTEEFEPNRGILHDVYFAIGKAEWMCGGISDAIYETIANIINSDQNIEFLRDLGASEHDLKLRKKNLDHFLASLSVARGKIKKRKIPVEQYQKIDRPKLPLFHAGDVFAYKTDKGYRILCFTRRTVIYSSSHAAFCYVWGKFFRKIPTEAELARFPVMPIGYFKAENFPDFQKLIYIGNNADLKRLDIALPAIHRPWKSAAYAIATPELLAKRPPLLFCMKISDGIKKVKAVWKE